RAGAVHRSRNRKLLVDLHRDAAVGALQGTRAAVRRTVEAGGGTNRRDGAAGTRCRYGWWRCDQRRRWHRDGRAGSSDPTRRPDRRDRAGARPARRLGERCDPGTVADPTARNATAAPGRPAIGEETAAVSGVEELIRGFVRDVPDYPSPGILFKDITPLLADAAAFAAIVDAMVGQHAAGAIDKVVGIEPRG